MRAIGRSRPRSMGLARLSLTNLPYEPCAASWVSIPSRLVSARRSASPGRAVIARQLRRSESQETGLSATSTQVDADANRTGS